MPLRSNSERGSQITSALRSQSPESLGGGDGSFGGSSVFSEMTTAQNGTGATTLRPTEGRQALGTLGSDHSKEEKDQALLGIEAAIMGAMDAKDEESHDHLSHLQISSSDEGLVIEIFEREDLPLFVGGDGGASAWLADMLEILSGLLNAVENDVAITAHVAAESPVRAGPGPWERSFANAQTIRNLLIKSNLEPSRILRMTGFADRAPVTQDPMLRRNNRIEIIVLRQG